MDSTKLKSLTYSPGHNKKRKEKKTLKKYYNLILSVALAKTKAVKRPTFFDIECSGKFIQELYWIRVSKIYPHLFQMHQRKQQLFL